jgi:hypothetical protein
MNFALLAVKLLLTIDTEEKSVGVGKLLRGGLKLEYVFSDGGTPVVAVVPV